MVLSLPLPHFILTTTLINCDWPNEFHGQVGIWAQVSQPKLRNLWFSRCCWSTTSLNPDHLAILAEADESWNPTFGSLILVKHCNLARCFGLESLSVSTNMVEHAAGNDGSYSPEQSKRLLRPALTNLLYWLSFSSPFKWMTFCSWSTAENIFVWVMWAISLKKCRKTNGCVIPQASGSWIPGYVNRLWNCYQMLCDVGEGGVSQVKM